MSILHLIKVYPASSILFSILYVYPSSHQSFLSFISTKFPILHPSKVSYSSSRQGYPASIKKAFFMYHLWNNIDDMHFSMYPITMMVCTFLCTLSQWWYALFYAPYMHPIHLMDGPYMTYHHWWHALFYVPYMTHQTALLSHVDKGLWNFKLF